MVQTLVNPHGEHPLLQHALRVAQSWLSGVPPSSIAVTVPPVLHSLAGLLPSPVQCVEFHLSLSYEGEAPLHRNHQVRLLAQVVQYKDGHARCFCYDEHLGMSLCSMLAVQRARWRSPTIYQSSLENIIAVTMPDGTEALAAERGVRSFSSGGGGSCACKPLCDLQRERRYLRVEWLLPPAGSAYSRGYHTFPDGSIFADPAEGDIPLLPFCPGEVCPSCGEDHYEMGCEHRPVFRTDRDVFLPGSVEDLPFLLLLEHVAICARWIRRYRERGVLQLPVVVCEEAWRNEEGIIQNVLLSWSREGYRDLLEIALFTPEYTFLVSTPGGERFAPGRHAGFTNVTIDPLADAWENYQYRLACLAQGGVSAADEVSSGGPYPHLHIDFTHREGGAIVRGCIPGQGVVRYEQYLQVGVVPKGPSLFDRMVELVHFDEHEASLIVAPAVTGAERESHQSLHLSREGMNALVKARNAYRAGLLASPR